MHMNSVPQHLLSEDRQEYERFLDEALRAAPYRPELQAVGRRLNTEQLRTMALNATALITAAAAAEYQQFVQVREERRAPSRRTGPATTRNGSTESGSGTVGIATTMGEVTEPAGAGVVAVLAVLAPVLAGAAAVIFLLVGYLLRVLDPEQAFARTLLTTGWVFGAVTAAAILVAGTGLLLTALRNDATSLHADEDDELDEKVELAREAWHDALLERGIMPFLREALADPAATTSGPSRPAANRMPHLGYNRPGFSSPDGGSNSGPRPSYSSPDFTSPDFGGPDHRPD
ncbi:hypothetical protein ACIQNU_28520 [Streptomyces sp. NPDC091292]|uniref:hypothetical protein n=1 Tax=Streptomyces sp. NPDC091292 TaxID=3365991 RepID=UPI003806FC55